MSRMLPFLREYPIKEAALLLSEGFSEGFRIPCSSPVLGSEARNLVSALSRPEVLFDKLAKEVGLRHMADPFYEVLIADLWISLLGVVPKKEANKFRLIHHLSYLEGQSVKDGIDDCVKFYTRHSMRLWFGFVVMVVGLCWHFDCCRFIRTVFICWEGQYFVDRC